MLQAFFSYLLVSCFSHSLHKVFPPSPGTYSQVRSINIIKLRFYFLILFNTNFNCDLSSRLTALSINRATGESSLAQGLGLLWGLKSPKVALSRPKSLKSR